MKIFESRKTDQKARNGLIKAGDLTLDPHAHAVHRDGEALTLSELSFAMLLELVSHAPDAVSNEQLAEKVWESGHVSAETIAQRVRILRRALDDEPQTPRYIRTIRNHGYAFVAPVEESAVTRPSLISSQRVGIAAMLMLGLTVVWLMSSSGLENPNNEAQFQPPSETLQMIAQARDLLRVHQADQTETAIGILETALETEPHHSEIQVSLSFALSTRHTKFRAHHDDSQRAEKLARDAIGNNALDSDAWHALAYALDAQARVDEALAAYQMAYELDPADISAMSSAAYLFQIRGRLYESLLLEAAAMRAASGQYARYADSQIALSLELLQHEAAATWRTRAQRIAPDHVVVLAETAAELLREANPDAVKTLLSAYGNANTTAPRLTRLLGRAALMKGDTDRARRLFEFAGYRASTDLIALNVSQGDLDSARSRIRELETGMLNGDSWPGTRIQLAELNAVLGNHETAIENISDAIDLGWLDTGLLRQSPFLKESRAHDDWNQIEQRIESQIAMQNRLVTQSDSLKAILSI